MLKGKVYSFCVVLILPSNLTVGGKSYYKYIYQIPFILSSRD